MSDFFTSYFGSSPNMRSKRRRQIGALLDPVADLMLAVGSRAIDKAVISRRVLAVGIEVPSRPNDVHKVLNRLKETTRQRLEIVTVPMAEGLGKFANIERALATVTLTDYNWLLVADDDISFEKHMLDRLITLSEWAGLSISQPAHKRSSFAGYEITLRKPWSFVRETHFVEIGPVTLFHRSVFADVVPFPLSRWCYGIDLIWSDLAKKRGFKMGIVDAATVRHLRPIGGSYPIDEAIAEGRELTKDLDIPPRKELLGFEKVIPLERLKDARLLQLDKSRR